MRRGAGGASVAGVATTGAGGTAAGRATTGAATTAPAAGAAPAGVAGRAGAATTATAGRGGGAFFAASACCLRSRMALRASPGLEMCPRLKDSRAGAEGRAAAGRLPRLKWPRTFTASSSSMELECVFFSVTPTALRASRIALLLTSSSRARSLIRTLLIQSFLSRLHFEPVSRVLPSAQLAVHSQPRWSRSCGQGKTLNVLVRCALVALLRAAITLLYPQWRTYWLTADRPPPVFLERTVCG
jgi:hypothetical protein